MNVALHGMEQLVASLGTRQESTHLIRYADDLVVLHSDRTIVEQAKETLAAWLRDMGLDLHPEKTRLVHTCLETDGRPPGFDFLGFTVRSFPTKQRRSRKGTKVIIKPSKVSQKDHYRALARIVDRHKAVNQAALIAAMNPVIRGWSQYHATQVSRKCFSRLDWLMSWRLIRWGKRRHSGTSIKWLKHRYWRGKPSRFAPPAGGTLSLHSETPIRRHIKVRGTRSPFDGDWVYWSARMGRHPEVAPQVARLLRRQTGTCARCGLYFKAGDAIENDHIVPRAQGGSNGDANRELLHRHCYDTRSAYDIR
jgi:RNA-directed DNA polymerase